MASLYRLRDYETARQRVALLFRLRDYKTTRLRVASLLDGFGGDICVGSKIKCVDIEGID